MRTISHLIQDAHQLALCAEQAGATRHDPRVAMAHLAHCLRLARQLEELSEGLLARAEDYIERELRAVAAAGGVK